MAIGVPEKPDQGVIGAVSDKSKLTDSGDTSADQIPRARCHPACWTVCRLSGEAEATHLPSASHQPCRTDGVHHRRQSAIAISHGLLVISHAPSFCHGLRVEQTTNLHRIASTPPARGLTWA